MSTSKTPTFIGIQELAQRTGAPMSWLRREAREQRLPYLRAGNRLLFNPEAVESALIDRARRSPEAAEAQK